MYVRWNIILAESDSLCNTKLGGVVMLEYSIRTHLSSLFILAGWDCDS
jgi:hypothetical protein